MEKPETRPDPYERVYEFAKRPGALLFIVVVLPVIAITGMALYLKVLDQEIMLEVLKTCFPLEAVR